MLLINSFYCKFCQGVHVGVYYRYSDTKGQSEMLTLAAFGSIGLTRLPLMLTKSCLLTHKHASVLA